VISLLEKKAKQIHKHILNSPVTKFEKEKEWENDMKKMLRIICWGRKLFN
jgi:hypothetical protein